MTRVRKSFDPVEVVAHKHSEVVEVQYCKLHKSDGSIFYEKVGERNVNDYVNSFKNGVSLSSLLERCSLMPPRDKLMYLNQNTEGVYIDVSKAPSSLTEAFNTFSKINRENPEIFKRLSAGESINSIISSFIPKKEVLENGTEKSSND